MTDYDVYWNGSDWSKVSSDLKPIRYSATDSKDFTLYLRRLEGTDKDVDVDASALVSYTDLPWFDANGDKVASGSNNTFHKGDGYGPYLFLSGIPSTTGNNTLKVTFKHKGSIWTDGAVTFHLLVKNMTDLTLKVTNTQTMSKSIDYLGSKVIDYETPIRIGYNLQGWYTEPEGNGTKMINANGTVYGGSWTSLAPTMTLYAYWTEKTYSVTSQFVNCSGSVSKTSAVKWSDDIKMSWTIPQERPGYRMSFEGASFEGKLDGTSTYIMLKNVSTDVPSELGFNMSEDANLSMYGTVRAKVRYAFQVPVQLFSSSDEMGQVGFSPNDLGQNKEKYVDTTSGYNQTSIYAVARLGYEFVRWDDGNTNPIRTLTVTQAVSRTAYFQERTYTITVKASTNGSISVPSSGTIKGTAGSTAQIVASPNVGYTLSEWKTSSTAKVTIDDPYSASTQITIGASNDTVTAYFQKSQTDIVLDANVTGGTDGAGKIEGGATKLTVSTAPKHPESSLWNVVAYYLNSGRSEQYKIAEKQSSTWKLLPNVSRSGVQYTDADGKWLLGTGTKTFYAEWLGKELTVTFNANGGTVTPTSKKVNYGSHYGDLPTPTNKDESLTFIGWYTAQVDGDLVDKDTNVTATANHTLYAHWSTGVVITFDPNGGYVEETRRTLTPGQRYDSEGPLPVPTWEKHTFQAWFTAATGGTKIRSNDTVPNANTTLYAHWTENKLDFSLAYNANGGSGAPATQTATDITEEYYDFTVSATVPTRAGYDFTGWAESSSATAPQYLANSKCRVTAVYVDPSWVTSKTLYAVWVAKEIPVDDAKIDYTCIYKADATGKAPGTAYIDVSNRLSVRPTIKEVENYGTTASFTIVNGIRSTDNLLASTCVWSSGTGAISTGQFVRIRHGSDKGMSWGWFFITSISVSDDLITVTCGDYIQWLRANGSDYYRNHYDPTGYQQTNVGVGWETAEPTYLYISKPSEATLIGGASADVKILVPGTEAVSSTGATTTPTVRRLTCYYKLRDSVTEDVPDSRPSALTSISISAVAGTTDAVGLKVYIGDSTSSEDCIVNASLSATGGTYTLAEPIYIGRELGFTVEVYPNGQSHQKQFTYNTSSGSTVRYYAASDSSTAVVVNNCALVMSFGMLFFDNASGTAVGTDRWKVTSTTSVSSPDSSLANPVKDKYGNTVKRGWIEYLDPSSGVSISEIVRSICGAADCSAAIGVMNRKVQMFRCGGGYYHDYLLTLADMTEDDNTGRRHAFCASTSSWASLMFGLRRKATGTGADGESAILYYGGDTAPSASAIPMLSFDPKKTMQYRPCKAVSKGLDNNGNPIIVCVKDPDIKLGSSAVTVESTDTSSAQAGLNAYNQIMTNRSSDWEGEVVIDGVQPKYMSRSGVYIGGVVVKIYDSRYGMSAMKARVREAVFDYQNLKTTLILSNYSEVYSNSINDTSKMAYTSGTLSLAASGEDLYLRQYVFIDVTGQMTIDPSATHTMKIHVSSSSTGTEDMTVTAECIAYPELGICTLVGYFAPGTAYSTGQYAVDKVTVDSTEISINSYRRPDKRDEQYVIVNVQCSI